MVGQRGLSVDDQLQKSDGEAATNEVAKWWKHQGVVRLWYDGSRPSMEDKGI